MADNHGNSSAGLESPAENVASITPHDTNPLGFVTRGIYVGGGGDVKVTGKGGTSGVFVAVPAGSILPVRASHVWSNGTTATNLLAMY